MTASTRTSSSRRAARSCSATSTVTASATPSTAPTASWSSSQRLRPDQLGQERRHGHPGRGLVTTGVPVKDPKYGTSSKKNGEGICPAAIGFKDQQPSAYSPITGLFYVPTNHICMDYEGVEVKYTAGQPYVGAIVRMFPGPGGHRGRFIAWDPMKGKRRVGDQGEPRGVRRRAHDRRRPRLLRHHGRLAQGASIKDRQDPLAVQDPVGHHRQPDDLSTGPMASSMSPCYSGIGGWAGIGVAAGIGAEDPTAGLGALGAFGDAGNFSTQGGVLTVFGLKNMAMPSKRHDPARGGGYILRPRMGVHYERARRRGAVRSGVVRFTPTGMVWLCLVSVYPSRAPDSPFLALLPGDGERPGAPCQPASPGHPPHLRRSRQHAALQRQAPTASRTSSPA